MFSLRQESEAGAAFGKLWTTCANAQGFPRSCCYLHDLGRPAARNMIAAGIHEASGDEDLRLEDGLRAEPTTPCGFGFLFCMI